VAARHQPFAERLRPAGHLRAESVDQKDRLGPVVAEALVLDFDRPVAGLGHRSSSSYSLPRSCKPAPRHLAARETSGVSSDRMPIIAPGIAEGEGRAKACA